MRTTFLELSLEGWRTIGQLPQVPYSLAFSLRLALIATYRLGAEKVHKMRFIAKFQERWIISRRPWMPPPMGQGGGPVQSPPHPPAGNQWHWPLRPISPRSTCLTSHMTAQTGSNSWKQVAWQRYSTLAAVQDDCSQGKMAGDRDWTPEDILALAQEIEGKAGWHRSPRNVV